MRLIHDLEARARRLNRFRWVHKVGIWRSYRGSLGADPWRAARYVLTDPELHTFSYHLANRAEVAAVVADTLDLTDRQVGRWFDELEQDGVLLEDVRRAARWRLDVCRHPRLGRHLARYAAVRALRPRLVVEAGVKDGLGSLVLLRALERNAEEGEPEGTLLGIDVRTDAGWLVGPRHAHRWQLVVEPTQTALPRVLDGRRVDVLLHDSVADAGWHELVTAIDHRAEAVFLMSPGNWGPELRRLCGEAGVPWHTYTERSLDHFYPGTRWDLALWPGSVGRRTAARHPVAVVGSGDVSAARLGDASVAPAGDR